MRACLAFAVSCCASVALADHMEDYWNEKNFMDTDYIPIPKGSLEDRGDPLFYLDGFLRTTMSDSKEEGVNGKPMLIVVSALHSRNADANHVYQSYLQMKDPASDKYESFTCSTRYLDDD